MELLFRIGVEKSPVGISRAVASYVINDKQGARKKVLDNRQ
jgi:hypothetical protein